LSAPAQLRWRDADGSTESKGGTLYCGPLSHRPSQVIAPRLTIYGPDGATYAANQSATIEGPGTIPTLVQAAPRGAGGKPEAPLRLTSTTGLKSRQRLVLGTPDGSRPVEVVKVRSVLDGVGLLLFNALLHDHETGAKIGGCRLVASITGAQVPDRLRRGRAVWEWGSEGSATRDQTQQTAVDVARYPVAMVANEDNLREYDAAFWARISANRDPLELLERGWDHLGSRLTARNVWGYVASEPLRWPTVYYAVWLEMLTWGKDYAETAEARRMLAEQTLDENIAANPSDPDEDASVTTHEQPILRQIRMVRA
jgi:hypothetical protein